MVELNGLSADRWAEADVDCTGGVPVGLARVAVDELQFLIPRSAELLVDDVLLYEAGDTP